MRSLSALYLFKFMAMFLAMLWGVLLTLSGAPLRAWGATPITLLHTNDLHSHFRGEKTRLGLGGVARLKTAVARIRKTTPGALLLDGGDWSEGNIYYNEGAGRETLKMMDHLGYDVAVVGNHDWLNGAETLLAALDAAHPGLTLLASNIETSQYSREVDFRRRIPPYVIKEVNGVKIAFIGLLTFEIVYDKFLLPIRILEPFASTRELAHQLKKKADVVVVISHNSIGTNKGVLLAAPDVDLVIGAHDHQKLVHPVVVNRPGGKPAWIVETGCWGRYLGQVDLQVTPRDLAQPGSRGSVELMGSHLIQMDASIPEDPETLSRIATLEALIEAHRGPIFHDHVGDSEIEIGRGGMESLMGDFATDAYVKATGADLSIDQTNFIYNELHQGPASTVDVFNSNPGVYSPKTDKAWTISTIPLSGRMLSWTLNLLLSTKSLTQDGPLNFSSDVALTFNPLFQQSSKLRLLDTQGDLQAFSDPAHADDLIIKEFKIRGEEIDSDRIYQVAVPGGVVNALDFLNQIIPGAVPLKDLRDTGIEGWRAMADHLGAISPVKMEKIPFGNRLRTSQVDLGLLYNDVSWEPLRKNAQGKMLARIHVRVRNTGARPSKIGSSQIALLTNSNGVNYAVDADMHEAAPSQELPALAPGESVDLTWEGVELSETLGVYALTVRLLGTDSEYNHTNDEVTRYF